MSRDARVALIKKLEASRKSRVVVYFCGDRAGAASQIADDSVRPLFDHVRELGKDRLPQIDLFLYSRGGVVDVPWAIVSMLREHADRWSVLVPYRAHSAATLISLGADSIVLGPKGELGPIDPILNLQQQGPEGTAVQQQLNVEDIMAYLQFVRERAGLSDQEALAAAFGALAEKVPPTVLGGIHRSHSHIRAVAQKMLSSHVKPMEEQRMRSVIETLAERTYAHGHAIGRREAKEIGLPVEEAPVDVETAMWELYVAYEELMGLREPIEPREFLGPNEEKTEPVIQAVIESEWGLHEFGGDLTIKASRKAVGQLSVNLNLNLQLPANIQPAQLPAQAQQVLQQMLQQAQQALAPQIQQEIARQMPLAGFESWTAGARWRQRQP